MTLKISSKQADTVDGYHIQTGGGNKAVPVCNGAGLFVPTVPRILYPLLSPRNYLRFPGSTNTRYCPTTDPFWDTDTSPTRRQYVSFGSAMVIKGLRIQIANRLNFEAGDSATFVLYINDIVQVATVTITDASNLYGETSLNIALAANLECDLRAECVSTGTVKNRDLSSVNAMLILEEQP